MGGYLSDRYDIYKFTGSAAIAETIVCKTGCRFAGFLIHADGALAAEALTATLDSKDGANYDAELYTHTMAAATSDGDMIPADERYPLKAGDEIDIAHANTNSRTYGLKIFLEKE